MTRRVAFNFEERIFFSSAAAFRRWLEAHHASARELWVGFYKKHSAKRGISYPEAVDQALCFGWIDGIRKRVDDDRYTNRFSPRAGKSTWSNINVKRAGELKRLGVMQPAGLDAFAKRDAARSGSYSFENPPVALPASFERRFKARRTAWTFFKAQPPGYRRLMFFFIMSAKREQTRERRFRRLVEASQEERRL